MLLTLCCSIMTAPLIWSALLLDSKKLLLAAARLCLPGFYGATVDGAIKLFQRGGGDITGAIVARCLDADLYENWTDVSGFLSADPRIVQNPRAIGRITFDEMRELSYMGASVLQEEAIFPCSRGKYSNPD